MNNPTIIKGLKFCGIILLVVGIGMVGTRYLFPRTTAFAAPGTDGQPVIMAEINGGIQEVAIDLQPSAYAPIIVQKGIPVRFNIRAEEKNINSCNATVVIPDFNTQVTLKPGDNILEFIPDKAGAVAYSCWMGMVTSSIQVVDDLSLADPSAVPVPGKGGFRMPCCKPQ